MVFTLVVGGLVLADDTAGRLTKVEDGSITITTVAKKRGEKGEEKTFKIGRDVKITRSVKDKEDIKLSIDELKIAAKVTTVFVTITHDGENGTAIKTGGGFGGFGGGRRQKKDKKDDK